MCPKSILSNLLVLSGAFPFLFATNLFPQYRLNCFLRVQKHRSAEGILDICRRGEEQQTAKQKYSKYTKLQIKVKSTYMNKNTVYTTLYMHNSQFLSTNHYCCTANKPSQPVLSHILQAYLKISIVRWLIIHLKFFVTKKNRKVYLG